MPNANDVNLLQVAQGRGLLDQSLAAACMSELIESERAGRPVRLAQVLLRRRLLTSSQIMGLMQELRDVSASGEKVVGEDTFFGMSQVSDSPSSVGSGEQIGGWILDREIARGGMGILFEGHHPQDPRQRVAIKVLNAEAAATENVLRRFQQEAQLAATLDHPNLIKVHGAGHDQLLHYLVMDYFEGRSLADLIRPGKLAPKKAIDVVAKIARACEHMHACGVVHRDIKPGNIMVGRGGAVCLVDFGLAKDTLRQGTILTMYGKLVGTPAYMSPEQARGEISAVGAWSDVYSLGAVLFRCVTGRYPWAESTFMKTIQAIATQDPPSIAAYRPDAPPALEGILLRAMAHDPKARPGAGQLAAELEQLPQQVPILMPPAPPSPDA